VAGAAGTDGRVGGPDVEGSAGFAEVAAVQVFVEGTIFEKIGWFSRLKNSARNWSFCALVQLPELAG
jgi:hypothetical protein